jgi:ABC-2 type transport system permease protein
MLTRIWQMLIKEFIQVVRDKRSLSLLLGPPVVQMLLMGYAITFEVRYLSTAVLDHDNTPESRELVAQFSSSHYFDVVAHPANRRRMSELLNAGNVALAIQIDPGFGEYLRKGQMAPLQVILDGTNSNTALVAMGYVNQITDNFARDYQNKFLQRTSPLLAARLPRVELERRPMFNPDMQSRWNFIPGAIGLLILIQVMGLTAFAIVRDREIGTLEQVMVTPIRRWEFFTGKTIPFFLIGLADGALIAILATFWFRIPFRGSLWVLSLGSILFLLCVLSVSLFISTVSRTQQQALVSSFFFQQPAIIFSGFGFPIASIPHHLQWLTYLDPLRYFEVVARSVFLKGVGLSVLWPQMLAMAIFAPIMFTISILRFHKSID